MKASQCAFTRLGSREPDAGWQAIPLDQTVSPKALARCALYQKQNIITDTRLFKAADMSVREIICDEDFLFYSRVQYGLRDELGRQNNLFSHVFVFPLETAVYTDPNLFLTIADASFIRSYEERGRVKTRPAKSPSFTPERALATARLDRESCWDLLFAYYAARGQKKPLFIKNCDNTEKMKAVIYLIFTALPYSFRKRFSCTENSFDKGTTRHLVFSEPRPGDYYFDLGKGESNILTPRLRKKFERLRFPGYAAENCGRTDSHYYFRALDKTAAAIGDPSGTDPAALKMAHQIIRDGAPGTWSTEACKERIHEALRAGYPGAFMDTHLDAMLRRLNCVPDEDPAGEPVLLAKEAEELLAKRLSAGCTAELCSAARIYFKNSKKEKSAAGRGGHTEDEADRRRGPDPGRTARISPAGASPAADANDHTRTKGRGRTVFAAVRKWLRRKKKK